MSESEPWRRGVLIFTRGPAATTSSRDWRVATGVTVSLPGPTCGGAAGVAESETAGDVGGTAGAGVGFMKKY